MDRRAATRWLIAAADPRAWNHALLVFMQQVAAVQVSPQ
jgi:hypothetical protein